MPPSCTARPSAPLERAICALHVVSEVCVPRSVQPALTLTIDAEEVKLHLTWYDGPPKQVLGDLLTESGVLLNLTWNLTRYETQLPKTAVLLHVLDQTPLDRQTQEIVWSQVDRELRLRVLPDPTLPLQRAALMLSMLPEDFSWSSALIWAQRNADLLDAAFATVDP